MSTDNPQSGERKDSRQSPLLSCFPASKFEYCEKFDMLIAGTSYNKIKNSNTVYDISHLPRFILAGEGAKNLISETFSCPLPNIFCNQIIGAHGKIGRISKNQFFLIDSLTGEFFETFEKIEKNSNEDAICLRTDTAEIALVGEIGRNVLMELTGLNEEDVGEDDFLPCDLGSAEVILSRVPAAIPHFRVLIASSEVNYIFEAIETINCRIGGTKEGAQSYLEILS